MKCLSVTIQMKATKLQYFAVVLFIMLNKVVLTFEFVGEILKCDHSSEKLLSIFFFFFFCGDVFNKVLYKVVLTFMS